MTVPISEGQVSLERMKLDELVDVDIDDDFLTDEDDETETYPFDEYYYNSHNSHHVILGRIEEYITKNGRAPTITPEELKIIEDGVSEYEGTESYRRFPEEYREPQKVLRLVTLDESERAGTYDDATDEKPFYWTVARGFVFNGFGARRKNGVVAGYADLVPEPGNPHHHRAVAVEFEGVKLGYCSFGYANLISWRVRKLNLDGYRVQVPVRLITAQVGSEWVLLDVKVCHATLRRFEEIQGEREEFCESIREEWRSLPTNIKDSIILNDCVISRRILAELLQRADSFPSFILPSINEPAALSDPLYTVLREKWRFARAGGYEVYNRRLVNQFASGRTLEELGEDYGLSPRTIKSILRKAGLSDLDFAKSEIMEEVRRAYQEGKSLIDAAEQLSLDSALVALIYLDLAEALPKVVEFSKLEAKRCIEKMRKAESALKLRKKGFSRKEAAAELGVSMGTLEKHLADGYFYEIPLERPERLEKVIYYLQSGGVADGLTERERKRTRQDFFCLGVTRPGVLLARLENGSTFESRLGDQ